MSKVYLGVLVLHRTTEIIVQIAQPWLRTKHFFSDAGAAENISMTLTELSVFMKKQELELQLRTEKEREEGEFPVGMHHIT